MTDVRSQMAWDRGQMPEGRGQETEAEVRKTLGEDAIDAEGNLADEHK